MVELGDELNVLLVGEDMLDDETGPLPEDVDEVASFSPVELGDEELELLLWYAEEDEETCGILEVVNELLSLPGEDDELERDPSLLEPELLA